MSLLLLSPRCQSIQTYKMLTNHEKAQMEALTQKAVTPGKKKKIFFLISDRTQEKNKGKLTISIKIEVFRNGNDSARSQEAAETRKGDLEPEGDGEAPALEPVSQNGLLHSHNATSPNSEMKGRP